MLGVAASLPDDVFADDHTDCQHYVNRYVRCKSKTHTDAAYEDRGCQYRRNCAVHTNLPDRYENIAVHETDETHTNIEP